jgi:CBS domain-containing protein
MLCRDVMKSAVSRGHEADTVTACARMMRDQNIGFVPIVDADDQVVGLVTDRDLVLRVLAAELPGATPVSEVMTRDVRVCHPDERIQMAEKKMAETRKSRLVVVDEGGRCLGVISLSDIAQVESRRRAGGVLQAVTRREASRAEPVPQIFMP